METRLEALEDADARLQSIKQTPSAREVGIQADAIVRKFVFKKCNSKPYYIRSLKNLKKILDNPVSAAKNELCGERAALEWEQKVEPAEQVQIRSRMKLVLDHSPNLIDSIEDLKNSWSTAHPVTTDFDAVLNHFKTEEDGEDIGTALLIVRSFYDESVFSFIEGSEVDEPV
jgi:hypothetical protein